MTEKCFSCWEKIKDCECGEETEGHSDEGAVCPYCGHVELASESEGYIYDESNETNECSSCGMTYEMDLYVSHTWTTYKIEG